MIGDYTYFDTNLIFDLGCPRTGQPQPKGLSVCHSNCNVEVYVYHRYTINIPLTSH